MRGGLARLVGRRQAGGGQVRASSSRRRFEPQEFASKAAHRAYSVWSRPIPTFSPGTHRCPRCRRMMFPAAAFWSPKILTPKYLGFEVRVTPPVPPAFLEAKRASAGARKEERSAAPGRRPADAAVRAAPRSCCASAANIAPRVLSAATPSHPQGDGSRATGVHKVGPRARALRRSHGRAQRARVLLLPARRPECGAGAGRPAAQARAWPERSAAGRSAAGAGGAGAVGVQGGGGSADRRERAEADDPLGREAHQREHADAHEVLRPTRELHGLRAGALPGAQGAPLRGRGARAVPHVRQDALRVVADRAARARERRHLPRRR